VRRLGRFSATLQAAMIDSLIGLLANAPY